MKNFIESIKKNRAIVAVLVMIFVFSFNVVKANSNDFGSILDKIIQIMKLEQGNSEMEMGASSGNMLAENYIPYVMYNGGYNSDKPIETSDTLTVGSTASITGALTLSASASVGTSLTVGTNLTGTDGIISYTDATASTTLLTNMITLARSHSDATNGADDGIGSCFQFDNEDDGGTSTSTARMCAVFDDTASTSVETSIDFYQKLDNAYTLSEVGTFDNGNFGIGSSTPLGDLAIGTADATSTVSVGNFCMYAQDEAGRAMYITLELAGNTVFATSTTPCNN